MLAVPTFKASLTSAAKEGATGDRTMPGEPSMPTAAPQSGFLYGFQDEPIKYFIVIAEKFWGQPVHMKKFHLVLQDFTASKLASSSHNLR